jgi:hypothetical protein
MILKNTFPENDPGRNLYENGNRHWVSEPSLSASEILFSHRNPKPNASSRLEL